MEPQIGSKLGKEYKNAVCFHPAYLTFMQCTSCEMDVSQAGIKIVERNINNSRYTDDTTLMTENEDELRSLLMKVKEESEKTGSKLNIPNIKIMVSILITHGKLIGKKWKLWQILFSRAPNHCRWWLQSQI